MIGWLLVVALALIVLFPDTPTAMVLRRWLIEAPARLLREITPRKLARALMIGVVVIIVASVAPEFLALMFSFGDLGLAIELFGALALLAFERTIYAALKRLVRSADRIASVVSGLIRRPHASGRHRASRTRRAKRPPSGEAEQPDWGDFVLA